MSDENQPDRLHALDAVRGFALLLGVIFHATMSFIPGPPLWIIMDDSRGAAMGMAFFGLHIFRMTLFFLIAGFFARMMFHRRGAGGFVKDRLKRIGLPLVVGWPILMLMFVVISIWALMVSRGVDLAGLATLPKPPAKPWEPIAVPLTHLWFLYVLLLLYAAALAIRSVVARLDTGGTLRRGVDAMVGRAVRTPGGVAVFAIPVILALMSQPELLPWTGIPTPDGNLIPNLPAVVGYGFAFGLGWVLQRQPDLLKAWQRFALIHLAIAVALGVAAYLMIDPAKGFTPTPRSAHTLAFNVLYGLSTWMSVAGLLGLSQTYLAGHSPARRYIADASYWIYIIHLPVLMVLQVLVAKLDAPWWIKFPGILAVAFPLMFASYHLMVRGTFISAVLNGKRLPTRKDSPSSAPSLESA
ncbi:MAG: acyltransferase family protein [Caulobacteraceae bacterium]